MNKKSRSNLYTRFRKEGWIFHETWYKKSGIKIVTGYNAKKGEIEVSANTRDKLIEKLLSNDKDNN